jgi:predicted nuclease of predicted toxin-antitoxin system
VRVLLDENLPHRLRTAITGHQVETVKYKGWNGLKNGELLRAAEVDGVQVLVTSDKNLIYQQSTVGRQIAIVTLSAQDFDVIERYLPKIQAAVDQATTGSFQSVDCGNFSRS